MGAHRHCPPTPLKPCSFASIRALFFSSAWSLDFYFLYSADVDSRQDTQPRTLIQAAVMQLHRSVLSASVLISTLFLLVRSSPLALDDNDNQAPLAVSSVLRGPVYEDGELPPLKDTEGWIDPRLNGGRFLDVSLDLMSFLSTLTLSNLLFHIVYYQEARRTSQHHNL